MWTDIQQMCGYTCGKEERYVFIPSLMQTKCINKAKMFSARVAYGRQWFLNAPED
jgi:hypothetical protein